jgi:hypothetical protein
VLDWAALALELVLLEFPGGVVVFEVVVEFVSVSIKKKDPPIGGSRPARLWKAVI